MRSKQSVITASRPAILAAMAIDESGYGTIRVALAANNIFSFKWISATQAGGRSADTLSCQPPEEQGKHQHRLQGSRRLDRFSPRAS